MAFGLNGEVLQALRPATYRAPITTGASDSSEVQMGGTTRVIMVHPTEDTFLHLGATGVATTANSYFLPADVTQFIRVAPSEYMVVKQVTTAGTLYWTEMA